MKKLTKKQRGGTISTTGYKQNSPDRFNDYNIIPSNQITMKNVPHMVFGIDNLGNQQMMYPGAEYEFPGQYVTEVPITDSSKKKNIAHFQDGGINSEDYYQSNATLAYYKEKLNEKLKSKNPEAFGNYFKQLSELRRSGKQNDADKYVQETPYNEFLSAQEVQDELGEEYEQYLNSLKRVNQYNVKQGKQPLYGTTEGDQDITKLNYGRRFASLMVTPSFARTNSTRGTSYSRNYSFNPEQGINYTETGDMSLNPYKKQQGGPVNKFYNPFDLGQAGIGNDGLVYGSQPGFVTKADTDSLGMFNSPMQDTNTARKNKFSIDPGRMASGILDSYLDPNSMYNVIGNISAGVDILDGRRKRKYDQERLRNQGSSDALFPVNQTTDRGDYVNTGTSYGMFRPDQMGAKSPDGMYNGMYYPTMQMGGDITTKRGNTISNADLQKFAANTGIKWESKEQYGEWLDKFATPIPTKSKSTVTYPFGKRGEKMTQDEWDYARSKGGYPDVYSDKVQGTDNFIPGEVYSNEIRKHVNDYRKSQKMAFGGLIGDEVSTPMMMGNSSTREMVSDIPEVPEFATLPVGLASRSSFVEPAYNPNKEVNINQSTKFAYDYLTTTKKLPSHIAAGIVGNLYQESGLKPGAVETTNTANGRGIAQWDKRDRWKGYLNWANENNRNAYDLKSQLDYVLVEPGESSRALAKLKNSTTPEQAAVIFGKLYERPSEKHANWDTRTSIAKKLHSGKFKEGGEYEMDDFELREFMANGGQVEFL